MAVAVGDVEADGLAAIPLPHHLYVLHEAGRRPDKIIETWSAAVRWLFGKIGGAIFKTRSAIYRVPFPF